MPVSTPDGNPHERNFESDPTLIEKLDAMTANRAELFEKGAVFHTMPTGRNARIFAEAGRDWVVGVSSYFEIVHKQAGASAPSVIAGVYMKEDKASVSFFRKLTDSEMFSNYPKSEEQLIEDLTTAMGDDTLISAANDLIRYLSQDVAAFINLVGQSKKGRWINIAQQVGAGVLDVGKVAAGVSIGMLAASKVLRKRSS